VSSHVPCCFPALTESPSQFLARGRGIGILSAFSQVNNHRQASSISWCDRWLLFRTALLPQLDDIETNMIHDCSNTYCCSSLIHCAICIGHPLAYTNPRQHNT
jgi:hypothetical protein